MRRGVVNGIVMGGKPQEAEGRGRRAGGEGDEGDASIEQDSLDAKDTDAALNLHSETLMYLKKKKCLIFAGDTETT